MGRARFGATGSTFSAALTLGLTAAWAPALWAQSANLQECADVVGTFLTKSFRAGESEKFIARSLLSFTNGGHVIYTDSGEKSEPGYRPFSEGQGAWRCLSKSGGKSRLSAIILDFTFPAKKGESQQIGRLDLDATFDTKSGKIESQATLSFVPLSENPMEQGKLTLGQKFTLVGEKISAPAP